MKRRHSALDNNEAPKPGILSSCLSRVGSRLASFFGSKKVEAQNNQEEVLRVVQTPVAERETFKAVRRLPQVPQASMVEEDDQEVAAASNDDVISKWPTYDDAKLETNNLMLDIIKQLNLSNKQVAEVMQFDPAKEPKAVKRFFEQNGYSLDTPAKEAAATEIVKKAKKTLPMLTMAAAMPGQQPMPVFVDDRSFWRSLAGNTHPWVPAKVYMPGAAIPNSRPMLTMAAAQEEVAVAPMVDVVDEEASAAVDPIQAARAKALESVKRMKLKA